MHSSHYLLSQQCSPEHVRTGCDVIKTCRMGLSPASSMSLLYVFIITPQGIYSEDSSDVCVQRSAYLARVTYEHVNTNKATKHTTKDLRYAPTQSNSQWYTQTWHECANTTTKPSTYTHSAPAAGSIHPGTPAAFRRFLPPPQSRHTDFKDLPLVSFSFHAITSESAAYISA